MKKIVMRDFQRGFHKHKNSIELLEIVGKDGTTVGYYKSKVLADSRGESGQASVSPAVKIDSQGVANISTAGDRQDFKDQYMSVPINPEGCLKCGNFIETMMYEGMSENELGEFIPMTICGPCKLKYKMKNFKLKL